MNRALEYHNAFIARLPQPTVIKPDSSEDEEIEDEDELMEGKKGKKSPRRRIIKKLSLLYEDDSEDEEGIDFGNFQLLPFTKQSKAGYIPRTIARAKVKKEMDIIENEYGRRSPELFISVTISEEAIEKAQAKVEMKKATLFLKDGSIANNNNDDKSPSLEEKEKHGVTSKYTVNVAGNSKDYLLEKKSNIESTSNNNVNIIPQEESKGNTNVGNNGDENHELLTYNCVEKDEQLQQVIVVSSSSQQEEEEEEEENMDEEKKESKKFVSQSGRDWYSS